MASSVASGGITFSGLSSGLDVKSIIDQLVSLRSSQLLNGLTSRQAQVQNRKAALTPLSTVLSSLRTSSVLLKDPTNAAYNAMSAQSSSESNVLIGGIDATKAVHGTYNITEVSSLAKPDKIIFVGVEDRAVTQFGTGTFTVTYKGVTTNVAITSENNTLDGIMSAINSADAGVTASIINDGSAVTPYRLILTSDDSGSNATITHTIDTTLPLLSVDPISTTDTANEPADAAYKVNGVTMSSHTNTVTDAIPGLTFSLLKTDIVNATTLTVKQDTSGIVTSISNFVKSYNTARTALKKATLPDSNTNKFGALGHDLMVSQANLSISRIMSKLFNSLNGYPYHSLASVGITADSTGVLNVDSAKLSAALETNPTSVRLLFQGTAVDDGIATAMYKVTDALTNASGTFAQRNKIMQSDLDQIQKKLEDNQKLVDSYKKILTAKFNRMEQLIGNLKSQGDALTNYSNASMNKSNMLL